MSSIIVLVEGVAVGAGAVSLGVWVDDGAVCFCLSFADAAKLASVQQSNIPIIQINTPTIAFLIIVITPPLLFLIVPPYFLFTAKIVALMLHIPIIFNDEW
jgi:hypothetical protein